MSKLKWSVLLAVLLAGQLEAACVAGLPGERPDWRYNRHADGTVSDVAAGLMWQQCAAGQQQVEGGCEGEAARLDWRAALQLAQQANSQQLAGHADWRLPSVAELRSLLAKNCQAPAINAAVFPATPPAPFWSSTVSAADHVGAWFVSFNNGNENTYYKDSRAYVRLVRGQAHQRPR